MARSARLFLRAIATGRPVSSSTRKPPRRNTFSRAIGSVTITGGRDAANGAVGSCHDRVDSPDVVARLMQPRLNAR